MGFHLAEQACSRQGTLQHLGIGLLAPVAFRYLEKRAFDQGRVISQITCVQTKAEQPFFSMERVGMGTGNHDNSST